MPKIYHNQTHEQQIFDLRKREAAKSQAGKELKSAQLKLSAAVKTFFNSYGKYPGIKENDFSASYRLVKKIRKVKPTKTHYSSDETLMLAIEAYELAYQKSKQDPITKAAYEAKRELKSKAALQPS